MQTQDFVYWLRGFFEIQNPETINSVQLKEIKNYLDLTLNKNYKPNEYHKNSNYSKLDFKSGIKDMEEMFKNFSFGYSSPPWGSLSGFGNLYM